MQSFKTELKAVSAALNSLSESIAVLVKAVDNSEKASPNEELTEIASDQDSSSEQNSLAETTVEPTQTKTTTPSKASSKTPSKASPKRKAVSRSKRKMTDTDRVVNIIKRAKRSVNIAELKKKTQFDSKKISNIVHRASKANRIKKLGRGFYSIVED